MGSSKKVTIGYRYYFGIHMGVGKSIDELIEIRVGDKRAWRGSATSNQSIQINAGNLFGGDNGEGGIQGRLDVMMGGADQPVNARLAAMLGGLVPAFRGVCTLFYDGLVTSLNPYPKPWKLCVFRVLSGWSAGAPWYPEKAIIVLPNGVKAMNPAHILYQVLTDRNFGNMDSGRINDAAWRAAADAFHAEGFGLCLRWNVQDGCDTFVRSVLDHVAASLFQGRETGQFELHPLRDTYDPDTLPLFDDDSGLLSVDEEDKVGITDATNEIIIKWVDPVDGKTKAKRERNPAAIASAGRIISETIEFPGLPTDALASRVAARELAMRCGGAGRYKLALDRRARGLYPGALFRFASAAWGITTPIVCRVARYEDGTLTNAAIKITATEDVFTTPGAALTPDAPSEWVPPDHTPLPATVRRVQEATWRDLALRVDAANLALIDSTAAYVAVAAAAPTPLSMGYLIEARVGSGAWAEVGRGDFSPTVVLQTAIGPTDTVLSVSAVLADAEAVPAGSAALLGDEIVRVVSLDVETGVLTVARGCVDTVPTAHPAGTRIWFADVLAGEVETAWTASTTVQTRLRTRTSSGVLAAGDAPTNSLPLAARQARPYPPGQFRIGGVYYPASTEGPDVAVSWAHRDRLSQADQVIDTLAGNIGPEAGTTYSCRLLRADTGAVLVTQTGVTGTTATLSSAYEGAVIVELWAVRAGLDSHQRHRWTLDKLPAPPEEEE